MPINAADARQLATVLVDSLFEDYDTIAKVLRPLRQRWSTIDWIAELTTVAQQHQPFLDSGLSIDWWLGVVEERSRP